MGKYLIGKGSTWPCRKEGRTVNKVYDMVARVRMLIIAPPESAGCGGPMIVFSPDEGVFRLAGMIWGDGERGTRLRARCQLSHR